MKKNNYFLVGSHVFLTLKDAKSYCLKHDLEPNKFIETGTPEIFHKAIMIAEVKKQTLEEQAEKLREMLDKSRAEIDRLVKIRDAHEQAARRNFDRDFDLKNVIEAIAKSQGIYEAYTHTRKKAFYYAQIGR